MKTFAFALCLVTASLPDAQAQAPEMLTRFLREGVKLDAGQIASIEKRQMVVKELETRNKEDVAIFGIVAIDVSRGNYVARIRDLRTSLKNPTRTAFGVVGNPASAADFEGLSVDSADVAEIPRCKSGECKIKMPAAIMDTLRQQIDWSKDPRPQVNAYTRKRLLDYVNDYRVRGDVAMVVYDDRGRTLSSDAFSDLLGQSSYIYQYVPSLHRYLTNYPKERLEGVTDGMYWANDSLAGLRPIISITHVSLYSPPELPGTTLIAEKQIFANHYFEAQFDLTTAIERPRAGGEPGIFLIVIRRFRFDKMPSIPMVNVKGRVTGRLKGQLQSDLENERAVSEGTARRGG